MIRDDFEACLAAYHFAELLLGDFANKSKSEQEQALEGATRLREEVDPRFESAISSPHRDDQQRERLRSAKSGVDQRLAECRALIARDLDT